ncbi:transmembrane protein, putative [Medicago truncatula]|uniref:Transmembrane protein, putative n=1 Tax=Medicago truncatula TaxID=3880 RepID=G7KGU2_MEDTR|nr:transmembrane protein, putative [Medicago truncatula]
MSPPKYLLLGSTRFHYLCKQPCVGRLRSCARRMFLATPCMRLALLCISSGRLAPLLVLMGASGCVLVLKFIRL